MERSGIVIVVASLEVLHDCVYDFTVSRLGRQMMPDLSLSAATVSRQATPPFEKDGKPNEVIICRYYGMKKYRGHPRS